MPIKFSRTIPVLRIFDERKAREFYGDFLGFSVDWEHRFEPNTPLFMQVSRGEVVLHLSEHHGDGVPGTATLVVMTGIEEYLRELQRKKYKYYRPGIQLQPWNAKELAVIDPFGNRIRFSEFVQPKSRRTKKRRRKP
ncbi:MAG: VOC family protein [Acidobacteriia bacterium]|nr:VOC family protein [Terriglobia bacterium]